jgi:hypothetical protein
LIVLSVGVWARKQWVFTIGTIVYALITAFNISIMIEALLRVFTPVPGVFGPQAVDPIGLVFLIAKVAYTAAVALAFNSLRKQAWHVEGERSAGAGSARWRRHGWCGPLIQVFDRLHAAKPAPGRPSAGALMRQPPITPSRQPARTNIRRP